MTAREAALVSLQRYENNKKFANIEADNAIRRNGLEGADRALYTAVFYGTIERKITLDHIIDALSSRAPSEIDANVRMILRMSIYQMRYMDRVPDYAILKDAGELCRRFAANSAVAFVNAVLRAYRREEGRIPFPKEETDPIAYLSVTYSYPAWLARMWCEGYGYARTKRLFAAMEENPHITLRVNTQKTDREAYLALCRQQTVGAAPTRFAPHGVRLSCHCPIDLIPGLAEGLCYVQDEASQIAVDVLGAVPGEHIIDACACPGGKSFGIAMSMRDTGKLYSCDLHKNKLKLVDDGAGALGLSCIETLEQNGSVPVPEWEGKADRVLCDVPCSGLGVLAKKPDIRHKAEEELSRLPQLQYAILENCSRYVREGGRLMYSTCTLNPAENEQNVQRFLKEHPEFVPTPFSVGEGDARRTYQSGMLCIFPDEYRDCDGFFIALFQKKDM